jgi:16S rRNA (cytosine967-C5)-methyltransferase
VTEKPDNLNTAEKALTEALARMRRWHAEGYSGIFEQTTPLVQNILYTYFRHAAAVNWTLAQLTDTTRMPPAVGNILRLGICELLFLQGLPAPTVVDVCVTVTRRRHGKKLGGLVNAVLRKVAGTSPAMWLQRLERQAPADVKLGLSAELYEQWRHRPGDELQRLALLIQHPAPVIIRLRQPEKMAAMLADGIIARIPSPDWMPTAQIARVDDVQRFFESDLLAAGACYVQDPATLLAPALLAPAGCHCIGDLCAAPGGKTLTLADLADEDAVIVAGDRSLPRLRRLLLNRGDDSLAMIQAVVADAAEPPLANARFDALLLDVPCSNTGVIRRRPDAQWRFSRARLSELLELQQRILRGASRLVKPGGKLVYSTCSIEVEENSRQVSTFLAADPRFTMATERVLLPAELHDGAYAAVLRRDHEG